MKLPIDVMAVFQEAMDVDTARSIPLCVSVLLDDTAPADLMAYVRSSFASASPQARVSVNYFTDGSAVFDPRSDMAVIAAGITPEVGSIAARIREAGVPVMVVTTLPELVSATAREAGFPIPEGDLLSPDLKDGSVLMLAQPLEITKEDADRTVPYTEFDGTDPFSLEPYALTEEFSDDLSRKMGEWVVAAFKQKRLAFAQAFDFVRRPLSSESVRATSVQNAGVGLVVVIPGADMPIMTLNQAKMILQIAAAYGQPLTAERVKELAAVVGGGFACRTVARQLVGVVPALGWAIKAAIGYSGTVAMGYAAIEYFEHGGNMAGLAGVVSEARAKAVSAAESTRAGRVAKATVDEVGSQARKAAADKAKEAVKSAPGKALSAARRAAATVASAAERASRAER
ncbi:YcjF family protein [Slackia sp.]|uniref:YcjF family protein n=1 Tax=Slackia sp. TaxID=2049041 RepID=UPI00399B72DD